VARRSGGRAAPFAIYWAERRLAVSFLIRVEGLPCFLVGVARCPSGLFGLVGDGPGCKNIGADPFDDIVHIHIAGLVAQAMVSVEDGAVHGAHTHAVCGGGDAVEGEGCVVAFKEEAATGGVVVDAEAVGGAGGDDSGIFGGAVEADEGSQCRVVIAGVVDVELIDCFVEGDEGVRGVPRAADQKQINITDRLAGCFPKYLAASMTAVVPDALSRAPL
jgi:hypothetical protein